MGRAKDPMAFLLLEAMAAKAMAFLIFRRKKK